MLTVDAKDLMLDALFGAGGIAYLSLHTAYSATGANEATGGSPAYARKAVTMSAAAAGAKAISGTVVFNVPAGTYRWLGYWTADSGGTFLGMMPLGGAAKEYTVDPSTDTFTSAAHGFVDTNMVAFFGGTTVPGGLTAGTVYYVVSAATDTFKVSATSGGAAIDITSTGTYNCVVSKVLQQVYTGQGTSTVANLVVDLTTL